MAASWWTHSAMSDAFEQTSDAKRHNNDQRHGASTSAESAFTSESRCWVFASLLTLGIGDDLTVSAFSTPRLLCSCRLRRAADADGGDATGTAPLKYSAAEILTKYRPVFDGRTAAAGQASTPSWNKDWRAVPSCELLRLERCNRTRWKRQAQQAGSLRIQDDDEPMILSAFCRSSSRSSILQSKLNRIISSRLVDWLRPQGVPVPNLTVPQRLWIKTAYPLSSSNVGNKPCLLWALTYQCRRLLICA